MRSRAELAAVCGLPEGSQLFSRLIEILDTHLHVITSAESEAYATDTALPAESASPEVHYVLTHDSLVPSIRQWLIDGDHKTWGGRARTRLQLLTSFWSRSKERRDLPTLLEYLSILVAVSRRERKPDQRALMRAAGRYYGLLAFGGLLIVAIVLSTAGWIWREASGSLEAESLIQTIYKAKPEELKRLIKSDLPPYRDAGWTRCSGRPRMTKRPTLARRRRAALALLPVDGRYTDFLCEELLVADTVEFAVICELLGEQPKQGTRQLWAHLEDAHEAPGRRFRAACALARYDPGDPRAGSRYGDFVANELIADPSSRRGGGKSSCGPVHGILPLSL